MQLVSSKNDNQITENSSEATRKNYLLMPFFGVMIPESDIFLRNTRLMKMISLSMIKLD